MVPLVDLDSDFNCILFLAVHRRYSVIPPRSLIVHRDESLCNSVQRPVVYDQGVLCIRWYFIFEVYVFCCMERCTAPTFAIDLSLESTKSKQLANCVKLDFLPILRSSSTTCWINIVCFCFLFYTYAPKRLLCLYGKSSARLIFTVCSSSMCALFSYIDPG